MVLDSKVTQETLETIIHQVSFNQDPLSIIQTLDSLSIEKQSFKDPFMTQLLSILLPKHEKILMSLIPKSPFSNLSEWIQFAAPTLFNDYLKPYFQSNNEWKSKTYLLTAILMHMNHFSQSNYWVMPCLCVLVEDYDPMYKMKGLTLLDHVLKHLSIQETRLMNLGLMIPSLEPILTFTEHPDLIQQCLDVWMEISVRMHVQKSLEWYQELDSLLQHILRVLLLTKGSSSPVPEMLLSTIVTLVKHLGLYSVWNLKSVLHISTFYLEHYSSVQHVCLKVIQECIYQCWPRISRYRGMILRAMAVQWMNNESELVKETLDLLKGCCSLEEWSADRVIISRIVPDMVE